MECVRFKNTIAKYSFLLFEQATAFSKAKSVSLKKKTTLVSTVHLTQTPNSSANKTSFVVPLFFIIDYG